MIDASELVTTLSLRRPTRRAPVERVFEPPRIDGFEIERYLGAGGMGVVFEARDTLLERRVALKLVRPDLRDSEAARLRLLREARALARLDHPNVVGLVEVGIADEDTFIAMELVDGGTLREWMNQWHRWQDVVDVFVRVGRGLAAVHELGLVHRDVNPSNVFLARDGTPKLGDFGLVLASGDPERRDGTTSSDPRITAAGMVVGTPAYMAPEQTSMRDVDARADQYAFCVSLCEALGASQGLPRSLRAAVTRGLSAEPDARFASMTDLLAALAA